MHLFLQKRAAGRGAAHRTSGPADTRVNDLLPAAHREPSSGFEASPRCWGQVVRAYRGHRTQRHPLVGRRAIRPGRG